VLVVAGAPEATASAAAADVRARVEALVAEGRDEKEALRIAAREAGLSRRAVYRIFKLGEDEGSES